MPGHPDVPHDDLPRSPTGRVPQWVVDEARTGLRTTPEPWRTRGWDAEDRTIRRRTHPVAWTLVVTFVLVATVAPVRSWAYTSVARWSGHTVHLPGTPTPGHEEADSPLGTPAPIARRGTSYAFMHRQADGVTPVTWDPCRPIHYVTRPSGKPAGGDELVTQALAAVTRATGLQFVDDGATTESASASREVYQPDRYGDRWAPVLITWATPAEQPRLAGSVAGLSGPALVTLPGADAVYVSGTVELDGAQIASVERSDPAAARLVVTHELGHLVGLDHVDDPTQAMNPVATHGVTGFGAGDLAGLARLGKGECRPDV